MKKLSEQKHRFLSNVPLAWLFTGLLFLCAAAPVILGYFFVENSIQKISSDIYADSFTAIAADLELSASGSQDEISGAVIEGLDSVLAKYKLSCYLLGPDERISYIGSGNMGGDSRLPYSADAVSGCLADAPCYTIYSDAYRGRTIYTITEPAEGYTLVCIYPLSQFDARLREPRALLAVSIAVSICMAALGTWLIYRYVTKPAKRLVHTMRNPSLPSQVDEYASWENEIGAMCSAYLSRARDYYESLQTITALNEQRRESEIEVLQSQINSHFIYNTLNNIQWLASANRNDDVIKTVKALDLLLRAWALNDSDFVTIEDELNYVEAYLVAQRIRFNDVFDFNFDVDVLLMQMKTPKFILQPIVENSIYHGFLDAERKNGQINISLRRRGHRVVFEVTDNGVGIEKERIQSILLNKDKSSGRYMGLAIGNINKRIKLLCGREYGIGIQSKYGSYTKIEIVIPVKSE